MARDIFEKSGSGSGFTHRGTYDVDTQYTANDLVIDNGTTYIAVDNTVGTDPATSDKWEVLIPSGGGGGGGGGAAPDALGITDRVRWLDANGVPAVEMWVEESEGGVRELRAAAISAGGRQVATTVAIARDAIELIYSSFGDTNGLLYYIGTDHGESAWTNPVDGVRVTGSVPTNALADGWVGGPASRNTAQDGGWPEKLVTADVAGMWYMLDLGAGHKMEVNYYTVRGRYGNSDQMKNWKLQGSNDNTAWTDLATHVNDVSIVGSGWAGWPVTPNGSYRYLRILSTGQNQQGGNRLALDEIEFYGNLTLVSA